MDEEAEPQTGRSGSNAPVSRSQSEELSTVTGLNRDIADNSRR